MAKPITAVLPGDLCCFPGLCEELEGSGARIAGAGLGVRIVGAGVGVRIAGAGAGAGVAAA